MKSQAVEKGREEGEINDSQNGAPAKEVRVSAREQKLIDEHHRLNIRIEELEHEIECLQTSASWKLTAPLRNLKPALGYLTSLGIRRQHSMSLNPFCNLIFKEGEYLRTGTAPYFILHSNRTRLPCRWVELSADSSSERSLHRFALYADCGQGFSEELCWQLELRSGATRVVKLPGLVRTLRLDPLTASEHFSMPAIQINEISSLRLYLSRVIQVLRSGQSVATLLDVAVRGGFASLQHLLLQYDFNASQRNKAYQRWIARVEARQKHSARSAEERLRQLKVKPLISVLMPVYNTPEKWLRKALDSVLAQSYPEWELCIVDDASTRPSVRAVLEEYRERDERVRVEYREENGHISASSNTALDMARGEYLALMDHDDELPSHALIRIVEEISNNPELDLIFTDEDRISRTGARHDPYFKAGWSLPQFLSQNIVSHLGVYRTEIAKRVRFRVGYEGSQDWDFALRFIEETSQEKIAHIPEVLYHWRLIPGTVSFIAETKVDAFKTAVTAVQDSLSRRGVSGRAEASREGHIHLISEDGDNLSVGQFSPVCADDIRELMSDCSVYDIAVIIAPGATALTDEQLQILSGSIDLYKCGVVGLRACLPDGRTRSSGVDLAENGQLRRVLCGLPAAAPGEFGLARVTRQTMSVDESLFAFSTDLLTELDIECYSVDADFELTLLQFVLELSAAAWRRVAQGRLDAGVLVRSDLQVEVAGEAPVFTELPDLSERNLQQLREISSRFQNPNLSTVSPDYFLSF